MIQSLALHARDERRTGVASHFARLAAARALSSGHGGEQDLQRALQLHRSANRAKHQPNGSAMRVGQAVRPAASTVFDTELFGASGRSPDDGGS